MQNREHDCGAHFIEHFASETEPFHFVDSGLSNVYLIGIKYFICSECGKVRAEIPAMKPLMRRIARDLVVNPDSLSGEQIRFLRKRAGMKSAAFAKLLGVEAETLSRYENDKQVAAEPVDKLIRFAYALNCDDVELSNATKQMIQTALMEWKARDAGSRIVLKIEDREWSEAIAA
jgi:putative zinc finger/helix-turn-helix YgiT family protein